MLYCRGHGDQQRSSTMRGGGVEQRALIDTTEVGLGVVA